MPASGRRLTRAARECPASSKPVARRGTSVRFDTAHGSTLDHRPERQSKGRPEQSGGAAHEETHPEHTPGTAVLRT